MAGALALRPPEQVMRLSRLGALHQSRLSFLRQITRRIAAENWQFSRPLFDINDKAEGVAIYQVKAPHHIYSLVCFAHDLPAEKRSDRVIAEAWDTTFALFDGVPTPDDITRLSKNVPGQEAGRLSQTELTMSRANRSVRLWDQVVAALASGAQPDAAEIDKIGYLMRTTAVYGSGKFGAADRAKIAKRAEFAPPFQVEMLTVYLIRQFVRDLVEHLAKIKGGDKAVRLDEKLARRLGIGNSTGLGMAPFLVNHPALIHNWINARENAIAKVRALKKASAGEISLFQSLFAKAKRAAGLWHSDSPIQIKKIAALNHDINLCQDYLAGDQLNGPYPWRGLLDWADDKLSPEGGEWLASLILEPYGSLVDNLCASMAADESYQPLNGAMRLGALKQLIAQRFGAYFADGMTKNGQADNPLIWYVSAEKLEPRLGKRDEDETLICYEQPLGIAFQAAQLYQQIADMADDMRVADFVRQRPIARRLVRRLQSQQGSDYAEIQDNILAQTTLPIDMLRAKLSFFGATEFDPRSDRWVRITMFKNAPYFENLTKDNADFWVYGD